MLSEPIRLSYSISHPGGGGSIPRIGYPPGGVGNGPIKLTTTGYPKFDVFYGWDTRRPEAILDLSILTPLS